MGYLLFFVILVAGGLYLYTKYGKKVPVVANTVTKLEDTIKKDL